MKKIVWKMMALSFICGSANAEIFTVTCGTNAYDTLGASKARAADFMLVVETKGPTIKPLVRKLISNSFDLTRGITQSKVLATGHSLDIQIHVGSTKYSVDVNGCSAVDTTEGILKYQKLLIRSGEYVYSAPIISRCTCISK